MAKTQDKNNKPRKRKEISDKFSLTLYDGKSFKAQYYGRHNIIVDMLFYAMEQDENVRFIVLQATERFVEKHMPEEELEQKDPSAVIPITLPPKTQQPN